MTTCQSKDNVVKKAVHGLSLTRNKFMYKPLVVGGLAMEYYGIRATGHDYDYVVSPYDWTLLKEQYFDRINLFGGKTERDVDATINLDEIHVDLISTLFMYNYDDLKKGSIEYESVRVISLDKLLFLKTLGAVYNDHQKSREDQKLIVDAIVKQQYSCNQDVFIGCI